MRIVVDAMGGDFAPVEIVRGAADACRDLDTDILLVGREAQVKEELDKLSSYPLSRIEISDAEDVVTMDDSPSAILRGKRNSSIHKGLRHVKDGSGDAFFSAGNTGAVMAVAKMVLKVLEGIDRPAIGAVLPTIKGHTVLLDAGANVECKPLHYLQFAIMGSAYAHIALGIDDPKTGLLSIGEEEMKGSDVIKVVNQLLRESTGVVNFHGNVEGKDMFRGTTDVIVCDGFSGNVALKVSESAGWFVSKMIKEEITKSVPAKIGALFAKGALMRVKERADYTEYGGAPLLGVGGVCIIGHGSSNHNAVKNGIRVAKELAENNLNGLIEEKVKESFEVLEVDKGGSFLDNILGKFKKKSNQGS
ncbi:phosphate acyltransferase PlsX [Limisalsivibrio acetivorans]|uniref:phosphate acyltransferase PlsX n=1 Tax=Limisalsivibrio acetivorans TaxID=1304888 RepID=UPI0003B54AF3|nr:phosphate acyltransferase PlsX [Limisalsivibrio acetivorans]